MLKQSFKQQLVEYRQKQQLTQEQLGILIGVEKQCVGNYEQGTRLPDLATLTQLGEALNVDIFTKDGEFFFVEAGKLAPLFDEVDNQLAFIKEIHEINQEKNPLNLGELLQRFYQRDWLMDKDDRQHTFTFPTDYLTLVQERSDDVLSFELCSEIQGLLKSEQSLDLVVIDSRKYRPAYEHRVRLTFEKADQVREIQQQVIEFQLNERLYARDWSDLTVERFHQRLCQALTLALSGYSLINIRTDELKNENVTTFKYQLTKKRLEKGLTQVELAQLLEKHSVTFQTISHYENGDREPSLEKIVELGQVLQCDVMIRKGGSFCFYDQEIGPLFFSSKDHAETIKQILDQSTIPTPNQVWITLDENNFVSQGYERDYSNYLPPQAYKQFYNEHFNQLLTPELEQTLIELFKDFLIDELWITDCASSGETFSTGVRFIYKDPEDAYQRQQNGILEILEALDRLGKNRMSAFDYFLYQTFAEIVGDSELERVEIISR